MSPKVETRRLKAQVSKSQGVDLGNTQETFHKKKQERLAGERRGIEVIPGPAAGQSTLRILFVGEKVHV